MNFIDSGLLPEFHDKTRVEGGPGQGADGPVFGLEQHAPAPPTDWNIQDVDYPISNDDLAATFDQTSRRELSADYLGTRNKVAALVGESALLASIRYMPEDTIILMDKSPAMVAYMYRYIKALREAADMDEWYGRMGLGEHSREYRGNAVEILRNVYQLQAGHWGRAGYDHPVTSATAFDEAKEQAQRKLIVPWRADITDGKDMSRLGRTLRAYDATITLLNLTNVLVCEDSIRTSEQAADLLDGLPFAPDVPIILTTEADRAAPRSNFRFTRPTRLFFGLDDLRANGGVTDIRSPLRGPAINPVVRG